MNDNRDDNFGQGEAFGGPGPTVGGNPGTTRAAAKRRRAYIYRTVKEQGLLELGKLFSDHPPISPSTQFSAYRAMILDDIEFFRELGINFELQKRGQTEFIHDRDSRHSDGPGQENVRVAEKKLVAKLTASLIIGSTPPVKITRDTVPWSRQSEILRALAAQPAASHVQTGGRHLVRNLADYHREYTRLIALDHGSTNEEIAALLAALPLPMVDSSLAYLSVCTNSRTIFNRIGSPTVPVRAIVLGGQQRGRTAAIAGAMTELFLRQAALLQFGMTINGTVGVDVERGHCFAENQEEAIIKQLLFEKASIRVLVADNGKLKRPLHRSGYAFSALNPNQVDLLITNAPVSMEFLQKQGKERDLRDQAESIEAFPKSVRDLRENGISVLVAVSQGLTANYEGPERVEVPFSEDELQGILNPA